MNIQDIRFLKHMAMERKIELLKFKRSTGGSVSDDEYIKECDRIIGVLEQEEEGMKIL